MRVFALITLLLFSFVKPIFAADISFSNDTSTIQKDQEIILDITLSGAASNTINYIRPAFYHTDSQTSYFGYVQNHNNAWYNGTPSPIDPKQFLEVQIGNEGSWSGKLKIKADTNSPYFKGNGIYFLKVGRYTASATSVSNWSEASQVEIQGVLPTLTPTLKPEPTEKSTPTSKPTNTPKPTKTVVSNTPTPFISEALKSDEKLNEGKKISSSSPKIAVLGESYSKGKKPTIKPNSEVRVKNSSNTSSMFIISGAVILIIGCGILLAREYRKQKEEEI